MIAPNIVRFGEHLSAGSSISARPGRWYWLGSGSIVTALAIMGIGLGTTLLATRSATVIACLLLLIIGLPHGALDIVTIRRAKPSNQWLLVTGYLGAAAAMFAVWWIGPLMGLAIFYVVAAAHFAQDWEALPSPLFGHAIAVALLSAPIVLHASDLSGLFTSLTGDARAAAFVDVLILIAPVTFAVTVVGLATMTHRQRRLESVCALTAMTLLPPVIGFAIFFCLFHSPRHLREGWAAVDPKVSQAALVRVSAMTLGGFGIAAIIYAIFDNSSVPVGVFQACIMTLSVLTVPHMLLGSLNFALAVDPDDYSDTALSTS